MKAAFFLKGVTLGLEFSALYTNLKLLLFFFKYNHSCMVVNLLVYMETSVVSSSAPAIMFRYQLILFLIVVFFGFPGLKGM